MKRTKCVEPSRMSTVKIGARTLDVDATRQVAKSTMVSAMMVASLVTKPTEKRWISRFQYVRLNLHQHLPQYANESIHVYWNGQWTVAPEHYRGRQIVWDQTQSAQDSRCDELDVAPTVNNLFKCKNYPFLQATRQTYNVRSHRYHIYGKNEERYGDTATTNSVNPKCAEHCTSVLEGSVLYEIEKYIHAKTVICNIDVMKPSGVKTWQLNAWYTLLSWFFSNRLACTPLNIISASILLDACVLTSELVTDVWTICITVTIIKR